MVALVLGNFQKNGALLTWIKVGHGPTVLAVGVGVVVLTFFFSSLSFIFSFSLSLSLGEGSIQTEILSQRAVRPTTTNQAKFSIHIQDKTMVHTEIR